MTDKKEQARKLRDSATILSNTYGAILERAVDEMQRIADELDPPVKERWERVRAVTRIGDSSSSETYWRSVLAEADKGMVGKEELKKRAPWFSGGSGPGFSPSDYDQGVAAFLRVLESL